MLHELKLQQLNSLVSTLSKEELAWINGYTAGLLSNIMQSAPALGSAATATTETAVKKITVLYGTESGNSKRVATNLAAAAKKKGMGVKLKGLDQYKFAELEKEPWLFVVMSTQGEGEPPATALPFFNYIHNTALNLQQTKFSVLALGDSSYPLFCKAGEDVDLQLKKLGATAIVPLQKADVDFDDVATNWFEQIFNALQQQQTGATITAVPTVKKAEGKKNYEGEIVTHINLNDNSSNKQTFHIEIAVDEAVDYQPGDAAGFVPSNVGTTVEKIIAITGINPSTEITTERVTDTAENILLHHVNICYLSSQLVQKYATIVGQEIPDTRMDLIDLLKIYPVKDASQFEEVIKILLPIAPRLYTISSSPNAHPNEIHVTVAKNSFMVDEEQRFGVCSEFLGDLPVGTKLRFYIHKNRAFKLPEEDKDIIMIGPGTGIAAFRSFVAERDYAGATGKNWLFFGDRQFTKDFLYQTEWQDYKSTGVLTKISLAWSRDTAVKHYVQHEIKKEAKAFVEWVDSGAYIFVCGAKEPMSYDVEATIIEVLAQEKNISQEAATALLHELAEAGRYEKDVY
jgi:sulfite reductase (NADPH) flavoprotein alpha-component